MARRKRVCPGGVPQHVIQRGNNRSTCFGAVEDYVVFEKWLWEASIKYQVAIHAWVFMTNHVHLLVTPESSIGLSSMMQSLGRRYVRYFNHVYSRTGTLWEGRFKSCAIDSENYLLACHRYIELNPVRAGMVGSPASYRWSSYRANGLLEVSRLRSPHELWMRLGPTDEERAARYRELFRHCLGTDQLKRIRDSVNRGVLLGSDRFRVELERRTGQQLTPLKRGPKPKRHT